MRLRVGIHNGVVIQREVIEAVILVKMEQTFCEVFIGNKRVVDEELFLNLSGNVSAQQALFLEEVEVHDIAIV